MKNKVNIAYAFLGVLFMLGAVFMGGSNGDSDILKFSIPVEAGGGTCGGDIAGRVCAIVATYGPADANSATWQADICHGYNNITDADSFAKTCAEWAAETGCTTDCDRFYQTEYRVHRRSCQSTTDGSVCSDCTSPSFAVFQCPNIGGGSGGGGGGLPTVDLVANPISVNSGGSSTLTWTVSNATSCSASASPSTTSWSGGKSASGGSQPVSNITTTRTYTITCSNSNGSASDSAIVTVGGVLATFDLRAGVTSPYTQSVTGTAPLNGVDAQFDVNISSGCSASCAFDTNGFYICDYQCSRLEYQLRCNPTDSWRTPSGGVVYNPENGNRNRTFINQCSYGASSQMQGRVIITKTSPTYSQTPLTDNVDITVNEAPGATCAPLYQEVEVGQPATVIGTPRGQSPLTCSWSGGGDPATSNLCNPFTTTYSAPGLYDITFAVNAANGSASCPAQVNVVAADPPDATLYTVVGTTTPYTRSLSGDDPINNVDASLAANILSGCGSSADSNINKCSVRYRVDCTRNGTWEGDFTYDNVFNGPKGYLFDNACSYSGVGTYYLRGQITVTKNSDSAAVKVVTEDIPIYVVEPDNPSNYASASCDPDAVSVQTNQQVTIDGNVGGNSPTCSWSGGGTPPTSTSCSPFQTTFTSSAGSPRTITLNVTAANGSTAQCTASITVTDPPPVDVYPLDAVRNGQGTITSDIPGINCGGTCRGNYDEGTTVVLTATPAPGWNFIGWDWDDAEEGCVGMSGNTCTVQVNGPRAITAKFRPDTLYEEF